MSSNTRFMNPPAIAKPGGYSHVVEITGPGRIVYIAGQLGLKPNGDIAGDFRAQVVQAFENLKSALAAVGAGFDDVVKLNNYLVDISSNIGTFREVAPKFPFVCFATNDAMSAFVQSVDQIVNIADLANFKPVLRSEASAAGTRGLSM